MSLLDSMRQSLSLDASGYPSRRPRSPSLNHNVKQPAERRISRLISTIVTASQHQPRSSVGAGYRCGVPACQTLKSPKKAVFFRDLWAPARKPKSAPCLPICRWHFGKSHQRGGNPRVPAAVSDPGMLRCAILGPQNRHFPPLRPKQRSGGIDGILRAASPNSI
jgi:hypothetical protein